MITHELDADAAPYKDRFVLWVPYEMRKDWDDYTRSEEKRSAINTLPEMEWLEKSDVSYSFWFRDWDIGGPHPIIRIEDHSHAALFKLTFHQA